MSLKIYISGKLLRQRRRQDQRLRSRPALRRRRVRGHAQLRRQGVPPGASIWTGLWNSAKAIWLEIPLTQEAMAKAVNDTLAANGIKDGYIRLVVTRGAGTLGLDPNRCSHPQVIIITDKIELYPEEFYRERPGDHHRQHDARIIRRR